MTPVTNVLLRPDHVDTIQAAVSAHLGRAWRVTSWTDLQDRSSHPAMIMRSEVGAVLAKLAAGTESAEQVDAELAGLRLIADSGVPTPVPVGSGRIDLPGGSVVLLLEALQERTDRSAEDWQSIGRALATLHNVKGDDYGAATDGFFGPLRMDNAPVNSNTWAEFYAVRRITPI